MLLGWLSNVVPLCCPLFKRELFIGKLFAGFQNRQDCPFSKAPGATSRHLSSNRNKGLEVAGLEKFSGNLKAFGAKRLRTYYLSIKLKAKLKNYECLLNSLLTKSCQTIQLKSNYNLVSQSLELKSLYFSHPFSFFSFLLFLFPLFIFPTLL